MQLACALTEEFTANLQKQPDDPAALSRMLYDLKLETVKQSATLLRLDPSTQEMLELAETLPLYSVLPFFRSRASLLSLALAVLIGWLCGGILATLLNFLSLGGDILRPVCILACLWLEDYLGSNPKARKYTLAFLGLGALGRFASSLAIGMARLGNFTSLRQLIFGSIPKAGFFKSLWLWLGAIFLIAFFAKKPAGLDYVALRHNLNLQIKERIKFCLFFMEHLQARDKLIDELEHKQDVDLSDICPKNDCKLALALIPMLPQLDVNAAKYLRLKLEETGYEVPDQDSDIIIWEEERHRPIYDPLGLVKNGDKCKILRKPVTVDGKLIKGQIQRLPEI